MTDKDGSHLIFLISQPRAGSTLLQRILGGHPAIHTTMEPTFMLHPLYALRESGYEAEYGAKGARLFTEAFLRELPAGPAEYDEAVRRLALYLYGQALAGREATYFLDKTPRYYFVIPDLARLFPAARFILLLRNPLAVLSSMLTSWVHEEWFMLHGVRPDLFVAPDRLLDGRSLLGDRAYIARYETLLAEPEIELRRLCRWLGLPFDPALVAYGEQSPLPRWRWGDQKQVYRQRRPDAANQARWLETLADPQAWRVVEDYRRFLGDERLAALGYNPVELAGMLAAERPSFTRRAATFSLDWLAARPAGERRAREKLWLRIGRAWQQRGPLGMAAWAVSRLAVRSRRRDGSPPSGADRGR